MSSALEAVNSAFLAAVQNDGDEEMLAALASDAEQLVQRLDPVGLANSKLWPMPVPVTPDWVNDRWEALKERLLKADENWDVWTDWYNHRMFGNNTDTTLEVARAADVQEFVWNEGPKSANAFIQKLIGLVDSKSGSGGPPDPRNNVAFLQWISTKPREWATVIAVRAALRMLPSLGPLARALAMPSSQRSRIRRPLPEDSILLSIFRGISASRYAVLHPQGRHFASDAAEFLRDREHQIAISAFYAASAVGADDAAIRAVKIISELGPRLERTKWSQWIASVVRDAGALVDGRATQALARDPLWRPDNAGGTPLQVREEWRNLAQVLRENGDHWRVWIDWYDYVLKGSPPANQRDHFWEAAFVDMPEPLPWEAGAQSVNTEIAARLKEHQSTQSEEKADELPDASAIPQQSSAASQFVLDDQGRLDLLPDAPIADEMQREIYEEVRYKALTLSEIGHNQLAGMSEPLARFLSAAPEHIKSVSITQLWSRGNTLRRRLKAHDLAGPSADPTDPAILSTAVAEMLRDLVESYNIFIVGDPAGRDLDQVRLGPQERMSAEVIVSLALPIVKAVREADGLATAAAIEALTEQLDAARSAPPGLDGDQAVDLSRKTNENLIVALLRWVYIRVRGEVGFAWKESRAGTYRYAGPALIASGQIPQMIAFLTDQAANLRLFVEQAFHNPTLVKIIDIVISNFALLR